MITQNNKIALFEKKEIRKIWQDDQWYFSVVDIIYALTESTNSRDYWYKMKMRVDEEEGFEPSTICRQFKLLAPDGKMRSTDCANTEGVLRIIQSIPSPKAEPFKRWLAKVGMTENKKVAKRGGKVAGNARKETEKEIGKSVISEENFLEGGNINSLTKKK